MFRRHELRVKEETCLWAGSPWRRRWSTCRRSRRSCPSGTLQSFSTSSRTSRATGAACGRRAAFPLRRLRAAARGVRAVRAVRAAARCPPAQLPAPPPPRTMHLPGAAAAAGPVFGRPSVCCCGAAAAVCAPPKTSGHAQRVAARSLSRARLRACCDAVPEAGSRRKKS